MKYNPCLDFSNWSYWEELFKNAEAALHGNDYEKWDMRKPSVNTMLWSFRNILKKGHYAY